MTLNQHWIMVTLYSALPTTPLPAYMERMASGEFGSLGELLLSNYDV